jgi:transcriptional regulator NrdR family protein
MKSIKSIGNFSERIYNKTNNYKKLSGLTTIDQDKTNKNNFEKNKLHEFNLNSNASKKKLKEKELKNIISNINLEDSMNSLERESNILIESELLNDLTSLNSYVQSPEKNKLE